jgi:Icc-related predicted phosphoesterase
MKFALASDLHFEFHKDGGRTLVAELPETDVIVVAGDLASAGCLWDSLLLLLRKYRHVIFVFGNHEFYGSSFQSVRQSINKLKHRMPKLREQGHELGELHLLDNSTVTIDGQRFVGTTLWFPWQEGIQFKHRFLNDFNAIKGAVKRIYEENKRAIEFLEETVTCDDVVVTHHLPHEKSVHPRWKGSKYNCFYLCEMHSLIFDRQPKLWVHGHTHDSCDYEIETTRVVCNPFGYAAHEENPSFDSSLILEP